MVTARLVMLSNLVSTVLVGACADEPRARSPRAAAPTPAAPVKEPALPRVDSDCEFPDRPAHRLGITAGGIFLDDVKLAARHLQLDALRERLTRPEVSLVIDADLRWGLVREMLAQVAELPGLRWWVGLRVGEDPQIRHLPISTPEVGSRARRPTSLPADAYTVHLSGEQVLYEPNDPLALRRGARQIVDQLLVSATDETRWQDLVEALSRVCAGSTLIPAPTAAPPPLPKLRVSPMVTRFPAGHTGGSLYAIGEDDTEPIALCFQLAVLREVHVRDRFELSFTVDERGMAEPPSLDPATPRDAELAACLGRALRSIRFHGYDGRTAVTAPFYLHYAGAEHVPEPGERRPRRAR